MTMMKNALNALILLFASGLVAFTNFSQTDGEELLRLAAQAVHRAGSLTGGAFLV